MPRFYFDTYYDGYYRDEVGSDLSSFGKAREEAVATLTEMARWKTRDSSTVALFRILIRDAYGKAIYETTLTIAGGPID